MKNRQIYVKDPDENKLLNNGVARVTDARTAEELRTLRFELETFVCDGQYSKGLKRIIETYLANLDRPEQPGVWVSGFFGSGKSHLVKMLRALWTDFRFSEDGATARGLAKLPAEITDLLTELSTRGRQAGGLYAASGTLGAGAGDYVRMALLGIVFRSLGLPEEYPLARFVMWLRDQGFQDAVKSGVEAAGKHWEKELRNIYVSPILSKALLDIYPDFAPSPMEARKLLKEQYPNLQDVTNQQMVDTLKAALSRDGKFPLTLIALDEVQQYIGDNQQRSMVVQEITETCCKSLGGRLLFVSTGQTALSGTPMLTRLMGRFQVPIELSDADVDAVIRQVILAKKPQMFELLEKKITENLGEISRHLTGTRLEHRTEDREVLVADYPILPVRRRFWERVLRSVDQAGTAAQLRNQLKVVHEAVSQTAEEPVGSVVPGDFIFDQIAPSLLQTGVLSREIYERIQTFRAGDANAQLKARLCGLIFLIGRLPREAGADLGVRATVDTLADLLVQDLPSGSADLRKRIPPLLAEIESTGLIMRVDAEYRLQTRESSAWNDEYRRQLSKIANDPQRIAQERSEILREHCRERLKPLRLTQGKCNEPRSIILHFGFEEPKDSEKGITVWTRDGWDEEEKTVLADVRKAGNDSPLVFVYSPKLASDDLRQTLASLRAATVTLEVRGVPSTPEGEEARRAIQTRESSAQRHLGELLDQVFSGTRVYQAGGQEIEGSTVLEAAKKAVENGLIRLYRNFDVADHPQWEKVVKQAQGGSESALEAVGYKGDVEKHPVTSAILQFVAAGKKGSEVRAHFEGKDYGWPRDAIDGGLYALLASGHLRAADAAHRSVDAKNLERSKIPQTNFRIESATVTVKQRIDIRKLLQDVGVPFKPNEELAAMPKLLDLLRQRAESAGGDAPLPQRPDTRHIDELSTLSGNEQLVAVHAQRETLAGQAKTWLETTRKIQSRLPRWKALKSLLELGASLAEAAEIQEQADGILDGRLLLSDPDPVPDLCGRITQLLRDAFNNAYKEFETAFEAGMETLRPDENWKQLTPEQRNSLLSEHGLVPKPTVSTGSEQEILASLRAISLGNWADRTAALPTRFEKVRKAAAELMEPETVYVKVKSRTLRNPGEVEVWLSELEQTLLDKLKEGPVVVL
jgi:hypothetical protein